MQLLFPVCPSEGCILCPSNGFYPAACMENTQHHTARLPSLLLLHLQSCPAHDLKPACATHPPAEGFYPALFTEIAQNYIVPHRPGAIDTNVAKYLVGEWRRPCVPDRLARSCCMHLGCSRQDKCLPAGTRDRWPALRVRSCSPVHPHVSPSSPPPARSILRRPSLGDHPHRRAAEAWAAHCAGVSHP